jgi:plasmid stabilization system protein ParE
MNLLWSKNATHDYIECISYLEKYFSKNTILKFIAEVEHSIRLISKNPETFPLSDYKKIRFIIVIPNITIFYLTKNETDIVIT